MTFQSICINAYLPGVCIFLAGNADCVSPFGFRSSEKEAFGKGLYIATRTRVHMITTSMIYAHLLHAHRSVIIPSPSIDVQQGSTSLVPPSKGGSVEAAHETPPEDHLKTPWRDILPRPRLCGLAALNAWEHAMSRSENPLREATSVGHDSHRTHRQRPAFPFAWSTRSGGPARAAETRCGMREVTGWGRRQDGV